MCMGSFDFFALFAQVFANIQTPEQLIELFEEAGMKPVQVVTSFNRDIRYMLQRDPCYDPMQEYEPFIPCLLRHGFAYDSDEKRFREVYYNA